MIVRRLGRYTPSSEGLYKPTRAEKVKKKLKSGLSRLNDRLEKDREAYKEQRCLEKQEYKEFMDKIKFKRKHYKDAEKKTLSRFRKKSSKKLLRGVGL